MSILSKYSRYIFNDEGNLIENPLCIPGLQETRLIQRFKFHGDNLSPSYMGSYEFEVANIHDALAKVISGIKRDSYSMVLLHVFGPPEFPPGSSGRMGVDWFSLEDIRRKCLLEADILIFCPNHIHHYAEELFRELAFEDETDRKLQEPSYLRYSLFSSLKWDREGAEREWSPMHPDALLDLDNAILALLTEPCARHFCETFGIPYIDESVQSADFMEVDETLRLLQQRKRLRDLQRMSGGNRKNPKRLPR